MYQYYLEDLQSQNLLNDPAQQRLVKEIDSFSQDLMRAYIRSKSSLFSPFQKLVKGFQSPEVSQGLYVWGSPGRGKTFLMDLFCRSLPSIFPWERVHFHEFMSQTHSRLHDLQHTPHPPIKLYAKEIAKTCKLLCFDEFHVSNIADAMVLGRLFEALFTEGVWVFATSNFAPDSLYPKGLMRERFLPFITLLQRKLKVLNLEGSLDYRSQGLSHAVDHYHWTLTSKTKEILNDLFQKKLSGHSPTPITINARGRSWTIEKTAKEWAWLSFGELCDQPKGADDYLALADHFGGLFLNDVPLLSPTDPNPVIRLMTLIDILYEKRVKLVISASTSPDDLYPTGPRADEFTRTLSRIKQMTNTEWHE